MWTYPKKKGGCCILVFELQNTEKRCILERPVYEGIGIWTIPIPKDRLSKLRVLIFG